MKRLFYLPFLNSLVNATDGGDKNTSVLGTMALAAAITGLVLVSKNVDLLALGLINDLCGDLHAGENLGVGRDSCAINYEDCWESYGRTSRGVDTIDGDSVSDSDLLLAATRLYNCVHVTTPIL